MIVGTAGHIDHGKTMLVRALTGVDTDRLPQERERGISIELGYAYLDVPPGADGAAVERIGFIDVPGHERLVHTMLAGATGIDHALLLVAADDGVMPQTREHLAVLSLLGLERGTAVITKTDRVDDARVAEVAAQVRALLAPTPLRDAPLLGVCAASGDGIEALRARLFDAARATPARADGDRAFRLAVDRAFTLDGVGTVVTGTVHAGTVAVGDELLLVPDSNGSHAARVRSLHAQNRSVPRAHAGQRCALALAGLAREEVTRGQWLVARGSELATTRLDVALALWHAHDRPLRSGTPVHVHLGAAGVMGSVAVLRGPDGAPADALAPGARGLVQLVLRSPVAAWVGERVVLRDNAASRTLAGGRVLDPLAPVRYRRTPQRLAELDAWSLADAPARLDALLAAAPHGLSLRQWALAEGLPPAAAAQAAARLPDAGLRAEDAGQGPWMLAPAHREARQAKVLQTLREFHQREPDALGPDSARLRRLAAPRLPEPLWHALLAALRGQGVLAQRRAFVHLPEHGLALSASDERIAQRVAPHLAQAGFEGSWVRDLAQATQEHEALMRTTLARLAQRGELHQVVRDLYYTPASLAQLAVILRRLGEQGPGEQSEITAARFRDATGLGRKRAIQLLEYFDRVGMLRRVGDVHRLRSDTQLFAPCTP